jgi:hypothetical protein
LQQDVCQRTLNWRGTYAFSDSSSDKRSAGIQGTSHPGGLREIAVWIACKGLISETCKNRNNVPGNWKKTDFSYWDVCRVTYRPVRTKS